MGSCSKIFIPSGTDIKSEELSNEIGRIITYRGSPPHNIQKQPERREEEDPAPSYSPPIVPSWDIISDWGRSVGSNSSNDWSGGGGDFSGGGASGSW